MLLLLLSDAPRLSAHCHGDYSLSILLFPFFFHHHHLSFDDDDRTIKFFIKLHHVASCTACISNQWNKHLQNTESIKFIKSTNTVFCVYASFMLYLYSHDSWHIAWNSIAIFILFKMPKLENEEYKFHYAKCEIFSWIESD